MPKQKRLGLLMCAAGSVLTIVGMYAIVSAHADDAQDRSYLVAQAADPKNPRMESWAMPVKAPEPKRRQASERSTASATPAKDGSDERGVPAGQLQPQVHASNGGITTCFDSLARASSQAVDGEHQAYSFWDKKRPNEGTFRSIVSLRYPHAAAPRGAAVIINGPVDGACDATTLQILPTLRPCGAIQGDLMKGGKAVANLAGLALIQTPQDLSYLLLPTAGDGCTIVAIRVIRSQ
jgi:hypothetical protein